MSEASTKASPLFTKVTLGSIGSLSNRIAMAPMTRGRATTDGVPTALQVEHYTKRASIGVIITEGTHVSNEGKGWAGAPGIWTPEQTDEWKKVTESVHNAGGKMLMQLWHQGRQSHSEFQEGKQLPVSSSAIAMKGEINVGDGVHKTYETPRALETEEIGRVAEDFRKAAANAKAAGFDGVEIHGANGYLLDQFLQSSINTRTDKYGGPIENRFAMVNEVIEAVLKEWPADKVGIRYSPNGVFGDSGSKDYVETFDYAIRKAAEHKLAFVHVMDGVGFGFHNFGDPYTLAHVKTVLEAVQGTDRVTSIIGNCGYTKELAEERIEAGDADLIAIGRPIISTPDLVERWQSGAELNPDVSPTAYYTNDAVGYTDLPILSEA